METLDKIKQQNVIKYSIVGFGSLAYPSYCQFAIDINDIQSALIYFSF